MMWLFFPLLAIAAPLRGVEVDCWHKAVDEGAFYCQHVLVMGTDDGGERIFPELAALDEGGSQTQTQANRACAALGFSYALSSELAYPGKEVNLVTLDEGSQSGWILRGKKPFIQHLRCGG